MELAAQHQLHTESQTWLNRGRQRLLSVLLTQFATGVENDMLDLGAGAGQHIPILARHGSVDAVETSPMSWRLLADNPQLRTLFQFPIPDKSVDRHYDVIIAMDVLEHIENDGVAAKWVYERLKPGGVFIATVPAYQWLFSDHDRANNHYRRYDRSRLLDTLPKEFVVLRSGYFNAGLFPIAVLSRIFWQRFSRRADNAGQKQASEVPLGLDKVFFGILATEAWLIGKRLFLPFGLSVFCVARKPSS